MWNNSRISLSANLSERLKDAVGENIASILSEYGIEYNPIMHRFVSKARRTPTDIAEMLTTQSSKNILAVLGNLRAEMLENYASKVRGEYEKYSSMYGLTEKDFSIILQYASGQAFEKVPFDKMQPIVDKINAGGADGQRAIYEIQTYFKNSIYSSLTKAKDEEQIKNLIIGRLTSKLKSEIPQGSMIDAVSVEEYIQENMVPFSKKELLEASGFSESRYPVSALRYWPIISKENQGEISDKLRETIDIDSPQLISEGIRYVLYDTAITSQEVLRISHLFIKFKKDVPKFLEYIKQFLISDGYDENFASLFIAEVEQNIRSEARKDTLFDTQESYFDSEKEREIVDLIRNEFNLQCVASDMRFPITNDFKLNKSSFIIDFVVYCDAFEGVKQVSDADGSYYSPIINQELLILGEYYGFDERDNRVAQTITYNLYDPEGNLEYKSGDTLTKGQLYLYKTKFKKITEQFCASIIGCKTLSINKATSRIRQIDEVIRELDRHKIIFNANSKDIPQSVALRQLMRWFQSADELSKAKCSTMVSKYFDPNTLMKKPGAEYKISKYDTAIQSSKKSIESEILKIAVKQKNKDFTTGTIASEEKSNRYLISVNQIINAVKKDHVWRFKKIESLLKSIQQAIANGITINDRMFLAYLSMLQDFSNDINDIPEENIVFNSENQV